jgi:hypothetical protein
MHEHWLNLVATVFEKTGWISEKQFTIGNTVQRHWGLQAVT